MELALGVHQPGQENAPRARFRQPFPKPASAFGFFSASSPALSDNDGLIPPHVLVSVSAARFFARASTAASSSACRRSRNGEADLQTFVDVMFSLMKSTEIVWKHGKTAAGGETEGPVPSPRFGLLTQQGLPLSWGLVLPTDGGTARAGSGKRRAEVRAG